MQQGNDGRGEPLQRPPMIPVPRVLKEWFRDNLVSVAIGVGVLVAFALIVLGITAIADPSATAGTSASSADTCRRWWRV